MTNDIKLALEYLLDSADYIADLAAGYKKIEGIKRGVTVFGSARTAPSDPAYESARKLGKMLAQAGYTVTTGGGGGIMEAANRGAYEAGGYSLGLDIMLPREQAPNGYTTTNHTFKYFFTRKQCLIDVAKAVICYAGGFGTLDELTEVLTQVQTDKIAPMPLILIGKSFWSNWDNYIKSTLLEHKMINPGDRELYQIVDTPEEAVAIIEEFFANKEKQG